MSVAVWPCRSTGNPRAMLSRSMRSTAPHANQRMIHRPISNSRLGNEILFTCQSVRSSVCCHSNLAHLCDLDWTGGYLASRQPSGTSRRSPYGVGLAANCLKRKSRLYLEDSVHRREAQAIYLECPVWPSVSNFSLSSATRSGRCVIAYS